VAPDLVQRAERQLDAATMDRPDFYPEGRPDIVLFYEWGLFSDQTNARNQLEAWGYRDGFISMLQGPTFYVRQQTHLFDGSPGARGMYGSSTAPRSSG